MAGPDVTEDDVSIGSFASRSSRVSFKETPEVRDFEKYKSGNVFQTHSDRIATLEERRRDLKKDYDRLQQFRPIEAIAEEA